MRFRRSMRRALLAAATTVTAVLATTGAANAAPNWSTSTITSTGPYVSGEVATYTLDIVNTGDAGGGTKPWRVKWRGPSFVNLQAVSSMVGGELMADLIATVGSVDAVMGDVDR